MNAFAYNLHAELNNDGSYRVVLFDVGEDESPIETIIERAKITIECMGDDNRVSNRPLLFIEEGERYEELKNKAIPAADVVPMSWVREHMSGDYISREQAVENAIDQMRHSASETAMRERLLNLVAADVRPVVTCAECKHNNACLTQAFVEEASRVPFDRTTFFCADGKRADDA